MKRTRTIILSFLIAISACAQDITFTPHNLTTRQIEQEWDRYSFYTIGRGETPDIKTLFTTFAMNWPNEFLQELMGSVIGIRDNDIIGNFILDTSNGYISGVLASQIGQKFQMTYWRCTDGSLLVGVAFEGYDEAVMMVENEDDMKALSLNGLMFYRIAHDTVIWNPETPKQVFGRDFHFAEYEIQLPRQGKDILLKYNSEKKNGKSYLLKWNGNGFNVQTTH